MPSFYIKSALHKTLLHVNYYEPGIKKIEFYYYLIDYTDDHTDYYNLTMRQIGHLLKVQCLIDTDLSGTLVDSLFDSNKSLDSYWLPVALTGYLSDC